MAKPILLPASSGVDRANRYIKGVLSGAIPACIWVKLACERQQRDLARKRWKYHFDAARANDIVEFIELLPHIKGSKFAGKPLILGDWQCFILTTVFGWVDREGNRRYRTAYVAVPRKNGKSTMTAPVGLYMVSADGEPGAEVYSAATTRDQAKIVWDDAKRMADRSRDFREALHILTSAHSIYSEETASFFKALSRDQQGNLDGLNVHCALVDELHGHKDRGVWDVLETATGSRTQALIWAITTAGSNRSGICYEQQTYVTRILNRVHVDETYFGIIYTIDAADDPFAESSWAKANPNYGVSVDPGDMRRKASKAMQMAAAQNNFLTKHLNVWVNADTAWMDMRAWERCTDAKMDIADFAGEDAVVAADLATKTDIAAKCTMFRRMVNGDLHYYAFMQFYLNEDAAEEERNASYSGWAAEGRLRLTPGNVTDFGTIEADIREDARTFRVIDAGLDPWQAASMIKALTDDGLPASEYRQVVSTMSEPMKELEALVLKGRFHHDGDPVLAWMISNVVCHTDAKDNIYPRKERPENKIDGAVAVIMGVGRWLSAEQPANIDGYLNDIVIA